MVPALTPSFPTNKRTRPDSHQSLSLCTPSLQAAAPNDEKNHKQNQTKPNFFISLVEKHFQELELYLQSVFQVVLLSWGVESFEALRPV